MMGRKCERSWEPPSGKMPMQSPRPSDSWQKRKTSVWVTRGCTLNLTPGVGWLQPGCTACLIRISVSLRMCTTAKE